MLQHICVEGLDIGQLHLAVSNHPIRYAELGRKKKRNLSRRSCRSLVTLCVYDDFVLEWSTDFHDTHDMPFLRHIRIFGNMLEVSDFLLSISAPDLERLTIDPIVQNDLAKLRRETSDSPRFPALVSLALAPAHSNVLKLRAIADATACFPEIKLLILPNFDKLSFVGSFKPTDSRPFWPELDGLAVRHIDDRGAFYEFV